MRGRLYASVLVVALVGGVVGLPEAHANHVTTGVWNIDGNAGTTAGTHFLGTTDDEPLEVKVGFSRALRIEPGLTPNLIGGSPFNAVTATVYGATIGGGGGAPFPNLVTDHLGTVGGGLRNQAGDAAGTVDDQTHATVGGGSFNTASGSLATVGGGFFNDALGIASFVGGGVANIASALRSTLSGGAANDTTDDYSVVAGGRENLAGDALGTNDDAAFATVGGGLRNSAMSPYSTVVGGFTNTATGTFATVVGGNTNSAGGSYALAAGRRAQATNVGSFVWADSRNFDFASQATNQFSARATGGVRFVSGVDASGNPTSGVTLAPGGGSWSSLSDRAAKLGFRKVDAQKILQALASLPMSTWSYKAQGSKIRHIGPVAQDFFAAFGVGEDERHISGVDADGVLMAAVQALLERIEALEADR